MKWSWKLTRLAGIDVYVHASFFILIAWIGSRYWQMEGNWAAVISGIGFVLALFACIVLHELGHALTARRYGIGTRDIVLLPIGGVASLERMPDDPKQEVAVALAGPAVNLVIALGLWLLLKSGTPFGSCGSAQSYRRVISGTTDGAQHIPRHFQPAASFSHGWWTCIASAAGNVDDSRTRNPSCRQYRSISCYMARFPGVTV